MNAVGIVQEGNAIVSKVIESGFTARIGDRRETSELRPAFAVGTIRAIQHAAHAIAANKHGDPTVRVLVQIVLGPTKVTIIGRKADVAMFCPRLTAVAADQYTIARIGEVALQRFPILLISGTNVVLKRQENATIATDNMFTNEGSIAQSTRQLLRLTQVLNESSLVNIHDRQSLAQCLECVEKKSVLRLP